MLNLNEILVIGDTILDEYIFVKGKKLSEEAPIITTNIIEIKHSLGGGSNVARNISSLGSNVFYIGLTSKEYKDVIQKCFNQSQIKFELFQTDNCIQKKTRIISMSNQIARYDSQIDEDQHFEKIQQDIISFLKNKLKDVKLVIISKYYDHFLTKEFLAQIIDLCKKENKEVLVDNRQANIELLENADFYKVNFNEFKNIYGTHIKNNIKDIKEAILNSKIKFKNILLTRSDKETIWISNKNNKINFVQYSVKKVVVSDVSGAGDTFVASFAIQYIKGNNINESILFANDICNKVVQKLGTSSIFTYEIENYDAPLSIKCDQLRMNSKKIGFTNGCFDIIHEGHIKTLSEARRMCDFLIVGLNSDLSVKKIKGEDRPYKDENERKLILESFRFVDMVIIFNESNVNRLLKEIKPDIYIKGGDYNLENIPEKEYIIKYVKEGLKTIQLIENKSSSNLLKKINCKNN